MARSTEPKAPKASKSPKAPKPPKEPGRLKQMYQVFQMTRRYDSSAQWWLLLAFVLPVLIGVGLALILSTANIFGFVMYVLAGILGGLLAFLIVLSRRAEKAAYGQIAGQPGAVGAVLKSGLRRTWTASEMPVAISPKTQDAVYRAVGRGGIVLIGEGPSSRTTRMLEDERRKVARILPNVPVNFLYVNDETDSVPLHKLAARMNRFKTALNKAEVYAVSNRVSSLSRNMLPIPKGVDPMRARAGRPR